MRTLQWAPISITKPSTSLRSSLANVRSLANKTFILKDFFTHRDLDLMLLTETWLRPGELNCFTELLPSDCDYLNLPRMGKRGGGVAAVLRKRLTYKQLSTDFYSSFEILLFELGNPRPTLVGVIYRPPKYNKDFIQDFSTFLARIIPSYDQILIVGDFNIHVCCPHNQLAKDFLNLIDSFSLIQHVLDPTRVQGHTLDLVLSFGLPIFNLEISDAIFSDHCPLVFNILLSHCHLKPTSSTRRYRVFKPTEQFSTAFERLSNSSFGDGIEQMDLNFNNKCKAILDEIAPFKSVRSTAYSDPWINDSTRLARRQCRKAERKWKKDKLQVSFLLLRESLSRYQVILKAEKSKFLASIIETNSNNP